MVVVQQPVGVAAVVRQDGRGRRPAVRIDAPPSLLLVGRVLVLLVVWSLRILLLLLLLLVVVVVLDGTGMSSLHRHPSGSRRPGNGGVASDVHDPIAILGPHLVLAQLQLGGRALDVMGGDGDGRRRGGLVQRYDTVGCSSCWWGDDVGVGRSVGGDVGGVAEVGHQVGLGGSIVGIACRLTLRQTMALNLTLSLTLSLRRRPGMDLGVPHHLCWCTCSIPLLGLVYSPSAEGLLLLLLLLLLPMSRRPSMARGRQPPHRPVVPSQHAGSAGDGVPHDNRGVGIIGIRTTALMPMVGMVVAARMIPQQQTWELGKVLAVPATILAGPSPSGRRGGRRAVRLGGHLHIGTVGVDARGVQRVVGRRLQRRIGRPARRRRWCRRCRRAGMPRREMVGLSGRIGTGVPEQDRPDQIVRVGAVVVVVVVVVVVGVGAGGSGRTSAVDHRAVSISSLARPPWAVRCCAQLTTYFIGRGGLRERKGKERKRKYKWWWTMREHESADQVLSRGGDANERTKRGLMWCDVM